MMIATGRTKRNPIAILLRRALVAAVAVTSISATAWAQYAELDKDAWVGVVTGDDVYIRSGAANSYYAFGKLDEGATVKVLEEKYNWARIAAVGPAFDDMFGYIKQSADEPSVLRLSADGTRGVTLGQINLIAPNIETGNAVQHSWKPVVRLQPDRELIVRKTIETDNQIIYAVTLPQDATGWMSMAYLRKANPQEAQKFEQALRGETPSKTATDDDAKQQKAQDTATRQPTTADTAGETPNRVLPRDEPRDVPQNTAADTNQPTRTTPRPAGNRPDTAEPAPTTDDAQTGSPSLDAQPVYEDGSVGEPTPRDTPIALDETTSAEPSTAADASQTTEAQPTKTVDETAETTGDETAEGKPAPPLTPKQQLEALEGAFERLREEPIETAEVDELRRLYTELIEKAADERQVRLFAKARAEQLRIWSDLQTRQRELKQLQSRMEMAGDDVQSVRHSLLTAGNYTVVGRVAASTVYDGTRLPRLYRVQDPGTGRTVAYLRPDREMDLVGMLGQLVGIIGDKQYDGSLGLHIIKPERVDLLAPQQEQPTQTGANAATETAGS